MVALSLNIAAQRGELAPRFLHRPPSEVHDETPFLLPAFQFGENECVTCVRPLRLLV